MLTALQLIGQCDPIEYEAYYDSQQVPVPAEIQTGDVECYEITPNADFLTGAIWSTEPIDLNNSFEYSYYVNLGTNNATGADGIVFVLSGDPDGPNAIGDTGNLLSYGGPDGVSPSIAVEFDTFDNGAGFNDILNDHAMLHFNGVMDGSAGPPINLGNIEDGAYHLVEVNWDAVATQFILFFDGAVIIDETIDLVNDLFGGDSEVLVGFTGSTGGFTNSQVVCDIQVIYIEQCNGIDDDCDGLIDEDTESFYQESVFICQGEEYVVGGSTYTTTGVYTDTLSNVNGCDSIITSDLEVGPVITYPQVVGRCEGEVYTIGSSVYSVSGEYTDVFQTASGCDSTIVTQLTVSPVHESMIDTAICQGSTYQQGNSVYTLSGTYTDVLTTISGCDSTIVAALEVIELTTTYDSYTICEGESIDTEQSSYDLSGFYEETYTSVRGCDSLVQFDVLVLPTQMMQQERYICTGGQLQVGPSIYTTAGQYADTLSAITGCDSIVTTELGVIDELGIPDSTLCDDELFTLDMNPFPFHSIVGHTSENDGVYAFASSGSGSLMVDLDGCVLQDDFTLTYLPLYDTESQELEVCDSKSLDLVGRSLGIDHQWQDGESSEVISVTDPGVYVKAYDYRCGAFQDVFLVTTQACECLVYVPTAFSPDDDKLNDRFGVEFRCDFEAFELSIYDRFGQRVYHSTDPYARWDGGANGYYVGAGVYAYVLNYRASEASGQLDVRAKGSVTVVR